MSDLDVFTATSPPASWRAAMLDGTAHEHYRPSVHE